jgi:methyl-accepting chemotaxis protein
MANVYLKKSGKSSSLKKRMIFYFLMIALANIFVAGEFIYEINSSAYKNEFVQKIELIKKGEKNIDLVYQIIDKLSQKFVIMILILIIVSAIVLFLFVLQIASPIQYMINQAEKMSDGDLSERINIKSADEIAVLGNLINDLSINLQEVIAQLERMVSNLEKLQDLHRENLENSPDIRPYFEKETIMMEEIVSEFKLLKDTYILYTINSMIENIEK